MPETETPPVGTDQLVDESDEDTTTPPEVPEPEVDDPTAKQIADLRREAASWRTKLRDTEASLEQLRTSSATDQESAIATAREEAKQEARTEALASANDRVLRAEVLAAATRKMADPTDAVGLLDLSQFQVNEDGSVDRAALATAVDELVKTKPHLAAHRDPDFGARSPIKPAGPSMDDFLRQAAGRA